MIFRLKARSKRDEKINNKAEPFFLPIPNNKDIFATPSVFVAIRHLASFFPAIAGTYLFSARLRSPDAGPITLMKLIIWHTHLFSSINLIKSSANVLFYIKKSRAQNLISASTFGPTFISVTLCVPTALRNYDKVLKINCHSNAASKSFNSSNELAMINVRKIYIGIQI